MRKTSTRPRLSRNPFVFSVQPRRVKQRWAPEVRFSLPDCHLNLPVRIRIHPHGRGSAFSLCVLDLNDCGLNPRVLEARPHTLQGPALCYLHDPIEKSTHSSIGECVQYVCGQVDHHYLTEGDSRTDGLLRDHLQFGLMVTELSSETLQRRGIENPNSSP